MKVPRLPKDLLPLVIVASVWLLFSYFLVGFPKGPMHGGSDQGGWEATSFYLLENIDFKWLIPRIIFDNNRHFYPEGISAVFQSWGIERDYFYGILHSLFGLGPWLGLYFSLSFAISCFGTYYLLKNRVHPYVGAILSIAATFINAYGVNKFPLHYGIAIFHWSLLSILTDHLLFRDLVQHQKVSVKLVGIRIFLLIATFGQELGYVAGLGLTSFVVHGLAIFLWIAFTAFSNRQMLVILCRGMWQEAFEVWRSERAFAITLSIGIVFIGYWYLGPLISIYREVKRIETPEIMAGGWWAHPMRFLAPLFSPLHERLAQGWNDTPDGFAPNSPGWALLSLALGGLFFSVIRRDLSVLPMLLIIALYAHFHPGQSKILGWLPWLRYARMGSRLTIAYPVMLCCIALTMHVFAEYKRWGKSVAILCYLSFFAFAMVEVPFIYRQMIGIKPFEPLPKEFTEHMKSIRDLSAEAVLDWPFCYTGGNGGGVCPHYGTLEAVWANRKYHHKKVMGTYFARLRVEDYNYYTKYGLDQLLTAQHARCLTEGELRYLKAFLDYYSFAGMQLYTTVIPHDCLPAITTVFGQTTRTVDFPGLGNVWYWAHEGEDLKGKQVGRTPSQFYFYRYQLISDLANANDSHVKKIFLPETQKPIYSFLVERFGKNLQSKIHWYHHPVRLDGLEASGSTLLILDDDESGPVSTGLPTQVKIIRAKEVAQSSQSESKF